MRHPIASLGLIFLSFEDAGLNILATTPEQFAAQIKAGFDVYAKAIKVAGPKPE